MAGIEKDPNRGRSPALPLHLLPGGVWRCSWAFPWLLLLDNLAGDPELFLEMIHSDVSLMIITKNYFHLNIETHMHIKISQLNKVHIFTCLFLDLHHE